MYNDILTCFVRKVGAHSQGCLLMNLNPCRDDPSSE